MAEQQTIDVNSPAEPLLQQHPTESQATLRSNLEAQVQYLQTPQSGTNPKCVLSMYIIGNLTLIIVSIAMLCTTKAEMPNTPIRAWIIVYTVQSFIHLVLSIAAVCSDGNGCVAVCQYLNNIIFAIWWIFGVYWVIHGGHTLTQNAPSLYWLAVVYLTLPLIVVVVLCIALPCLLCCLACIISVSTD